MTIEEMKRDLVESAEVAKQSAAEAIKKIEYTSEQYVRALTELGQTLPGIEKGLNAVGLTISKLSYHQTGDETWSISTSLNISLQAAPINGNKFKFIAFNGYTTRGEGKNRDRLNAKALKIEAAIEKASGVQVNVNPCSIEMRVGLLASTVYSQSFKQVLITFWVK